MKKLNNETLKDLFPGKELLISYNHASRSAIITNNQKEELTALTTFWFAWYTFHPETEVFQLD